MNLGPHKMPGENLGPSQPTQPSTTPVQKTVSPHQCHSSFMGTCSCGSGSFGKKILLTIAGVLMVYAVFYLGTLMRLNMKKYVYVGQADQTERTITVSGYGKMNGKNDIAMTTIGFTNTDKDVAKAQADNKKVMDQVMADLKKMKIEDKDLESNYSIYPQYDYTDKGSVFRGYQITNNVSVKIRDLSKISDVLELAGKYGANSVNGLSFTVDDTQALKTQARAKALADAKSKAATLAQNLGVYLSEVISYNEYDGSGGTPYPMANNFGMGAGVDMVKLAPQSLSSGSQDVEMNVNVTYKIVAPQAW